MRGVSLGLISLALLTTMSAQDARGPADAGSQLPAQSAGTSKPAQVNTAKAEQMRRDAEELAALTKSIPADVTAANKNLYPKGMDEKLKRIEKLSKQLRKELAH